MSRFSVAKIIPVALLILVLVALSAVVIATGQDPRVDDLRPVVVEPGSSVAVSGLHFGRDQGTVTIAGQDVPTSAIVEWSDDRIEFRAPISVGSGLLFVETGRGRSDGWLVQAFDAIPRTENPAGVPGAPEITGLSESALTVGSLVVVSGANFGDRRRNSEVVFPTENGEIVPSPASISYPVWSDSEIHVRVPAGVSGGFLHVETAWGHSNARRVSAEYSAGRVTRGRAVEIGFRYGAEISDVRTIALEERQGGPGRYDVAVWLPTVNQSQFQSRVRSLDLTNSGPLTTPVRWDNVPPDFSVTVSRAVVVDRFEVVADFDPVVSPAFYESESGFFAHFTSSAPQLPASDQVFVDLATQLRDRNNNPITIARALYLWELAHMRFDSAATESDAYSALETGVGNDRAYSLLFVTLLRAARVPARPVGGIRVSADGVARPHMWAEFFVSHIGWIPVDPALADGAGPRPPLIAENPREYYFGNLDPYRVAFVHGVLAKLPLFPDGRTFTPAVPYTIQRVYGEVGPGVDDANIDWIAPALLGMHGL